MRYTTEGDILQYIYPIPGSEEMLSHRVIAKLVHIQ